MLLQPGPLLNEANKGGYASPWSDHDDGRAGFEGQAKLRLPDVHGHQGVAPVLVRHLVLEPVGGHPFVQASRLGLILHCHSTDVDGVGVHLQGRDISVRQRASCSNPTAQSLVLRDGEKFNLRLMLGQLFLPSRPNLQA